MYLDLLFFVLSSLSHQKIETIHKDLLHHAISFGCWLAFVIFIPAITFDSKTSFTWFNTYFGRFFTTYVWTGYVTVTKYFVGTWTDITCLGEGEDVCGGGCCGVGGGTKGSNCEKKQTETHITSKLKNNFNDS